MSVGGSFNSNPFMEPKSGVSGSFHLAVPDSEAEPLPDLAMSVNCTCPIRCPWESRRVCCSLEYFKSLLGSLEGCRMPLVGPATPRVESPCLGLLSEEGSLRE